MRQFAEPFRRGWQQVVEVTEILHDSQTDFQHMQVVNTVPFGRMMILDDACQTSEIDEYIYHEMLVHVPMMTTPQPATCTHYRRGRWRSFTSSITISHYSGYHGGNRWRSSTRKPRTAANYC